MRWGCNKKSNPPLKDQVKKALEQNDLKDVKVAEDIDKNVVTLSGTVHNQDNKVRAEQVARAAAPGRIVADEISVQPVGQESAAKEISKDEDTAIEKNFKAALVENHLDRQHIRFDSNRGVLTLKGSVKTDNERQAAQQIAASVPNVQQVGNELQVKGRGGM